MGQLKKTLALFKAAHPWCCFCGGKSATTTVDHVPNRAFFRNRDWPEGYEFPSCGRCNAKSRLTELIVSALARSAPARTAQDFHEVVDLYTHWARRDRRSFEEFVGPLSPSGLLVFPASVRVQIARRRPGEMNIGQRLNKHLSAYAEKLLKALYYKHASIIVPSVAEVTPVIVSNGQIGEPHELELRKLKFPGQPTLVRCSNSKTAPPLYEQFHYSYGIDPSGGIAVFKVRLNESFLIAGVVDPKGALPLSAAADLGISPR
jgi:hypothetical protein